MEITRSVHIDASADRVFALIADPHARAALNPTVRPLEIEIEDRRPLHVGSICRYRIHTGRKIVDFNARVRVFEPNRRLVSVIETTVPIEVEIQVEPDGDGGTHLAHTERFEPSEAMLQTATSDEHNAIMAFVYRILMWFDLDIAQSMRERRERRLKQQLEENLASWLTAIKEHVETTAAPVPEKAIHS